TNGAINGTQSLKIVHVAKTGYITGAELGSNVSSATKLSELGVTGDATIAVTTKSGTTNIALTADMTVNDVVNKLKDAGVSANFDAVNKRMFVSAKDSGIENDFALTATDANGIKALQGLGIYVNKSANADAYAAWAAYENTTDAELANILETINTYQGDASTAGSIKELQQDSANRKTENTNLLNKISYANSYLELKTALKAGVTRVDGNGDPIEDADGNEIVDPNLTTAEQQELANLLTKQDDLTEDEKTRMEELKEQLGASDEDWEKIQGYASTVKSFEAEDDNASDRDLVRMAYVQGGATDILHVTNDWTTQMEANNNQITANTEEIADKNAYIQKYALLTGAAPANDTTTTAERVAALRDKINFAVDQISNPAAYSDAVQVAAQNAEIELNGVTYKSASNSITVNDLTITALQETNGQEISITTSANVQGMYDTIKDFLKQYNELIKEMDTLYNAESSKGYEPLTDDEKDAMTDTEIEKWEKKIKDSILRRDDTLSSVMNLMTTAMSKSFKLSNGKTYSLSSFGIKTQGYFAAEENESSVFHIDGDADDELTSGNADKLMKALQEDPDSVQEFFQQLTGGFYDALNKKMGSTTQNHSIYT
ncbi:MAG: flagellar filament capping protein FliD, partial [Parasporobacterium sp.]|nr:flagellar filament capping protein FliD [Parasporobacterium sp.]